MAIVLENGYEMKTTFWSDFTIADAFGVKAIQDTYNRAFGEWKNNTEYVTELAMVLNFKLFQWYDKQRYEYWTLYDKLWKEIDAWCMNNLKGDDLDHYIKTTD